MAKDSSGKALVIVESPAKARTIGKFLGKNYIIEASIGHIRDLPQGKKNLPEKYKGEEWADLGLMSTKSLHQYILFLLKRSSTSASLKKLSKNVILSISRLMKTVKEKRLAGTC